MVKKISKEPYKLSEKSKQSGKEFGEANKTLSLLYDRFKNITGRRWPLKRLHAFKRLIQNIIKTGPEENKGHRKFWDGDLSKLLDYELNQNVTFSTICKVKVEASLETPREMRIKILPFEYARAFKTHKDASFAELKFYVLSFDFERFTSAGKSILALSQPVGKDLTEGIELSLTMENINNRLVLLVKHVYFKRFFKGAHTLIENMRYVGAVVALVAYVKDGELMQYEAPKKQAETIIPDEPGVWLSMD